MNNIFCSRKGGVTLWKSGKPKFYPLPTVSQMLYTQTERKINKKISRIKKEKDGLNLVTAA